jgi:hypothetical protein
VRARLHDPVTFYCLKINFRSFLWPGVNAIQSLEQSSEIGDLHREQSFMKLFKPTLRAVWSIKKSEECNIYMKMRCIRSRGK